MGQSSSPPAAPAAPAAPSATALAEAASPTVGLPSAAASSPAPTAPPVADVVAYSPDGLPPAPGGITLELTIDGVGYAGSFFVTDVDHLVASYSLSERMMNRPAAVRLSGPAQGGFGRGTASDRWLFSLPASSERESRVLVHLSVLGRSGDANAPAIMQAGYDISVRLAAPAEGARALSIEVTPNPAIVQAREYRYSLQTTIVGGTLRVPLAADDGNSYIGRFELNVADVLGRKIGIEMGRGRSRSGLEVFEPFGYWQIKLKALRGTRGNPVPLVVVHAPPNDIQGLAPDDMERAGYTVAVMGRRDGQRLFFSVELVIGGLVGPQPTGGA